MPGQVVILGPGLLGGSLALALAKRGQRPLVWGRRQAPLDILARRSDHIQLEPGLENALGMGDFIVLATPIGVMPDLLQRIAEITRASGAQPLITDVGSVKAPIVAQADTLLGEAPARFIGSHPMAGSEASGVEAAHAELFDQARCILTPTSETRATDLDCARQFWAALNCEVHELDPHVHDRVVAHISHMPHALASVIVRAALGKHPDWATHSGAGLLDSTRIASGDPAMWAEILLENRSAVVEALRGAEAGLRELIALVETGENTPIRRFLLEAKELRDTHIVP